MRPSRQFWKQLKKWGACPAAITWARRNRLTTRQCWNLCGYAEWMFWFLGKAHGHKGWPTKKEITQLACLCIRDQIIIIGSDWHRARAQKLLDRCRRWAEGKDGDDVGCQIGFKKGISYREKMVIRAVNAISEIVVSTRRLHIPCNAFGYSLRELNTKNRLACEAIRELVPQRRLGRNL